ncbi:CD209 antigen-like protein E [Onychostoma macrolepis]|nr:CD209 antigen-like protein E [Onychostoma macrolepis]
MELETIYENIRNCDITDTSRPRIQSYCQNEGKARKQRGSRCLMLITVGLGLICVLLVVFIILQHITITRERQLLKPSCKNIFQLFNETTNSLQEDYTDLMIKKDQLQNSFSSLSQKKLELETTVNGLTAEKDQLQRSIDSLSQKKLELETELRMLSGRGNGKFFYSYELKSWSDSRHYCRDHGGDLVIINSEEKQRLISSFIKERVWIGLSDIQQEGNMKWVDNSPLKQGFWDRNEPNDANGAEDCIELNPAKSVLNNWNDIRCSDKRKWICEN